MSGPGYVFKDSGMTPPAEEQLEKSLPSLPLSATNEKDLNNQRAEAEFHSQNFSQNGTTEAPNGYSSKLPASIAHLDPTPAIQEKTAAIIKDLSPDNHELAQKPTDVMGAVQTDAPDAFVRDIGWHKSTDEIPDPLIGGLSNGRLFSLIRRFNKDVFVVRAVPPQVARGLDLNEAWAEEYATDKLTLHLERVYLTFVLGFAAFGKHVARLRSWKETGRTAGFCITYFIAWIFDLLMPLVLGILMLIIASKEAREFLFPPAPLALVNTSTGGLQKPQAGQLGTSNTLTGAPEKQEGEAVEEEASHFVGNIRHLVQKVIGMHEGQQHEGDPLEGKIPAPVRKAVRAVKGADTSKGHATEDGGQTEVPMEEILWSKANPEMLTPIIKKAPHVVGEIVDNWERFANAISPTSPFSSLSFLRIDGVLLPLFMGSFFISYYMVYKGTGFAIGFGLFGDPILTPALEFLNRKIPNWMELLEPKNNILRGVPTNSQLTLTLLRIGEVHNTPLPPVSSSKPDDPDNLNPIDPDDLPVGDSRAEKINSLEPPSSSSKAHSSSDDTEEKDGPKHKHLSKITRIFKGNTKAVVETKLAADHVRAAAGSKKAKGHLGVLPKEKNLVYAGPSDFKARYDGKKGWIFISEGVNPILAFTSHDPTPDGSHTELDAVISIAVNDIKELKRSHAFVNKPGELAANWSEDKQLLGSLEVEDDSGKNWKFTALPERDELFNRLIALGSQRWENL